MRIGTHLLLTASILCGGTTWVAAGRAQSLEPATRLAQRTSQRPSTQRADYVGSSACESCHPDAFARWKSSLHIQMTRPVDEATVVGDFSRGTTLSAEGRSYEFGMRAGKPVVTVRVVGRPAESFAVDDTLGSKRLQGYWSTLPDGRIYVLPAFWHVESRRWLDWQETTPVPDGAHDLKQIWNVNCFMSGPLKEYDPQGEFWPDGPPNRFNRTQDLTLSGCFKAGAATCTSCHLAHGSTNHEFSLMAVRGVLQARAGKFPEAIASWKAARDRDPTTPNLQQMIDAASRRLAAPPRR